MPALPKACHTMENGRRDYMEFASSRESDKILNESVESTCPTSGGRIVALQSVLLLRVED